MKNILFILLSLFLITGCADSADQHMYAVGIEQTVNEEQIASPKAIDVNEENVDITKKIIKEGEIRMEVSNMQFSKKSLDSLLSQYKGYYAKEDFQDSNYQSTYFLIMRIPNQSYENFIIALEAGHGKIMQKKIEARDVTEQYLDINTRLENKRAYLKHYREILKKANTIKDILEVEQHIRTLEEEIESAEGKFKYLSDKVTYSTLNLTVIQQKEYTPKRFKEDKFFYRLKTAFASGWEMFVSFILGITHLWPFVLIFFTAGYIWQRRKKKEKNK